MIKHLLLSELIKDKINLRSLSTGWNTCKCALCGDYKERASFKFINNSVIYSCFNCSTASVYEELSGYISGKFRDILHAYGIEDSEINLCVNSAMLFRKEEATATLSLKSLTKVNTHTPAVALPPNSFRLGHLEHFDEQVELVKYLDSRKIDLEKYPFYFSTESRFRNRVIIPFFRNGSIVYWQARSINPLEKKRYDNCIAAREAVMFNMDQLNRFSPMPLFVSEGVFDAMMFDGIAVLGSKLTPAKMELLNKTRRRLVFPIDKDKNGKHLAETVLAAGWEITFAPDGADDLNHSVKRFGKAWTAQQLMLNIPKDSERARLAIKINCGV